MVVDPLVVYVIFVFSTNMTVVSAVDADDCYCYLDCGFSIDGCDVFVSIVG